MVVMIGGRSRVGGRTLKRKDCMRLVSTTMIVITYHIEVNAYRKLSRAPQALNDAKVVKRHSGEQEFCGIIIATLPVHRS